MVYTKDNGDKVDALMKKFGEYCGVDFSYVFGNCYIYTEISLGTHAIDFRNFVELETGFYITDSDWINTGVFTWEKLVEHLNKGVYNNTPWVEDDEGFELAMKRSRDILASFKVAEKETFSTPYNPVKNISIEKYYRCAKGAPSQCDQFYSGNGVLFMSESDCGKYYYWEDYNRNNELIFFRGEKSWVEDNYQKVGLWSQVITPVKDEVVNGKKVKDLGEVTLIGKKEDNSVSVSYNVGKVVGKIKDRVEDNRVGCVDNQLIKTSDVEEFERKLSAYVVANNLNNGFPKATVLWEERKLGADEEFVETVSIPEADDLIKTNPANTWTDKHYDFTYTLTEEDIESGKIKIDPYFVNRMWRINSWDDTGAAFHSLKNYARICNGKNPLERDLKSLYKQVKRLCELYKVEV